MIEVNFDIGYGLVHGTIALSHADPPDDECAVVVSDVRCADQDGAVWAARSAFTAYRLVESMQQATRFPIYGTGVPAVEEAFGRPDVLRNVECYPDSRDRVRLVVGDDVLSWRDVWDVRLKHARVTFDIAAMPSVSLPGEVGGLTGDLIVRTHPGQLAGRLNSDPETDRFMPSLVFGVDAESVLRWNDVAYNPASGVWEEVAFPLRHRGAEFRKTGKTADAQPGVRFDPERTPLDIHTPEQEP